MKTNVPAMDELIGQKFPVLSDGFVYVVDYMGNDSSIVQAARVSYGAGTKSINEDRGLIRYMMRNAHTSPFEQCEIKLHIRIPMDAWRQFIRHRTANVNEYSTRYSLAIDSQDVTSYDSWRLQSGSNKQGSDGFLDTNTGVYLSAREEQFHQQARELYEERIDKGVAREQARKDLPLSTYTEAYWKTDLHNLFHFLRLRMDHHAQKEIRSYADIIGHEIVAKWVPIAWEAFVDYRLESISFSAIELRCIAEWLKIELNDADIDMQEFSCIENKREREELRMKLKKLLHMAS